MGQWVGSGLMTNNGINLDLIEIIQFCLKIYDLKETPPPMGGCMDSCVDEWFSGSMGGVRSTHQTTHTPTHGWGCLYKS